MADRFYGLDKGEEQSAVTEQTSSPTKDVEVTIDLATIGSKFDALRLLKRISDHITTDDFPPA